MFSFTFIFIFLIIGAVCTILLVISFIKLFENIYPRLTYYNLQNQKRQVGFKQYERISRGNVPEEKIDYSIIYTIHRQLSQKIEFISIKNQIEILSSLMEKSIKSGERYEIVCVVDPKNYNVFRYISSLYQDHRYITPVLRSTSGIEFFINGFIYSKGSIVIDSEFISEKINEIIEIDRDKPFIELFQPRIERSFIFKEENHFLQPTLITRSAGELIFANLHMTNFGLSNEIFYLCKYFNIEPQIQVQKIGYTNISIYTLICNLINEKLCLFLYSINYWSTKSTSNEMIDK